MAVADIHKVVAVVAAASVFQTYLLQVRLVVDSLAPQVVVAALIHRLVVACHKLVEVAYRSVVEVLHTVARVLHIVVEVLHNVVVVPRKGAVAFRSCSQGTAHYSLPDNHKLGVVVDNPEQQAVDKLPSEEQLSLAPYSTVVAVLTECFDSAWFSD